jgi:cell fate regulator YaaT (PSP1 superfamily)
LVSTTASATSDDADTAPSGRIVRKASPEDHEQSAQLQALNQDEYSRWLERIAEWELQLELIDLEWTLDRQKLILYVLSDRGAETTKLALQAAAAGLAAIDVQPVGPEGVIPVESSGGGGCGSGGGGCGSGGCH